MGIPVLTCVPYPLIHVYVSIGELTVKHPPIDKRTKRNLIRYFESECKAMKHKRCHGCRMVSLNLELNNKGFCSNCVRQPSREHLLKKKLLPLWYKDGVAQFHVPPELKCLSHAEKMLIQRVSPFVPLHHILNGLFGLTGHVCAFEQKISEMANILPRFGKDTTVIRVLQEVKAEIGSDSSMTRTFKVNRKRVLDALEWLKVYNREYADITIDASRLDWIEGDESDLDTYVIKDDTTKTAANDDHTNADMGPCATQCLDPQLMGTDIHAYGYLPDDGPAELSATDQRINNELQHAIRESHMGKQDQMEWPEVSDMPVNEYDDTRIFARAFPWLFPGGYGDIKDFENSEANLASWGRRLLYYEDGRFAADKLFVFFCMNYIVRHRNSSSGKFFIDNFQRNVPETLDELKETIRSGDMSFVNHLTYWNKRIKGSNPYWFQKRAEVYTWINEHMQLNHGAPTMFITLSCAEYFWPDVIRLLKDRLQYTDVDLSEIYIGSPKLIQLVNDYTIVIQEYFQNRVEKWLQTVGKTIFHIKHYWVRYEFAPGRGQIHAHLLAIPDNHDIFEECHLLLREPDGEQKRADHLANWARENFGLTACVKDDFDTRNIKDSQHSVEIRFSDVNSTEFDIDEDAQQLLHMCQQHKCSDFCMRTNHGKR